MRSEKKKAKKRKQHRKKKCRNMNENNIKRIEKGSEIE